MSHNSLDLVRRRSKIRLMQKAVGSPVLVRAQGQSSRLERVFLGAGMHSEDWLQALIFKHPELLPVPQIEPAFGTIIPAAREIACGHGSIDNLYLTPSGEIILVETKLWRNVQARREVVAQALDYVSSLTTMGFDAFEAAVLKGIGAHGESLYDLVAAQPDALDEAAFVDAVSVNLARGRMLVIALGDGIRQEAEALASLLQSHAGAHFTFALVELAVWKHDDGGDLVIVPSTLAQTVMIKRGILTFEAGVPQIKPVPTAQQFKPQSISEEMFFESLGKLDPGLPGALRAFIAQLEPLGIYPDLKASLNLKADLPYAQRPTNFGYIAKNGQVWTNPFGWTVPESIAREYNRHLAELIGGTVADHDSIYLSTNGTSAPRVTALLPEHANGWAEAIERAIRELRVLEPLNPS